MEINIKIFDLVFTLEQFINITAGLLSILVTVVGLIWGTIKKIRLPKLLIYVTENNKTLDFLFVNNSEKIVIINYIEKNNGKQAEKLTTITHIINNLINNKEIGQIVLQPFSSLKLDYQSFKDVTFNKKTKIIVSTNYGKYKAKLVKTNEQN